MNGRLPNPLPLKLHQITFTPHPEASFSALMHLSIYDNETKLYRSKATSKFSFAFRMPINVSADITIRMETRRGKVLLEFSFHTGFMTPGLIRVTRNDLDQEGAGAYDSMDLVFSDFSGISPCPFPSHTQYHNITNAQSAVYLHIYTIA